MCASSSTLSIVAFVPDRIEFLRFPCARINVRRRHVIRHNKLYHIRREYFSRYHAQQHPEVGQGEVAGHHVQHRLQ
jgi:hypothetical protein